MKGKVRESRGLLYGECSFVAVAEGSELLTKSNKTLPRSVDVNKSCQPKSACGYGICDCCSRQLVDCGGWMLFWMENEVCDLLFRNGNSLN